MRNGLVLDIFAPFNKKFSTIRYPTADWKHFLKNIGRQDKYLSTSREKNNFC